MERKAEAFERITYTLSPDEAIEAIDYFVREIHGHVLSPQTVIIFKKDGSVTVATDYPNNEKGNS